jgi:hypothetical protein
VKRNETKLGDHDVEFRVYESLSKCIEERKKNYKNDEVRRRRRKNNNKTTAAAIATLSKRE